MKIHIQNVLKHAKKRQKKTLIDFWLGSFNFRRKIGFHHGMQFIYEAIDKQDRFENKIELSAYF